MILATGLNLTSCNNIILMQPWWNPFVEVSCDAMTAEVWKHLTINQYQLITKDSVEEQILEVSRFRGLFIISLPPHCIDMLFVAENSEVYRWSPLLWCTFIRNWCRSFRPILSVF